MSRLEPAGGAPLPHPAAAPNQLAFLYRNRAEMERQFVGRGRQLELAFVYRDRAEMERQLDGVGAA